MLLCVMYQGMPNPLTPSSTSKWKSWNFTLAAISFAISADSARFMFLKHLFNFKAYIENESINNEIKTSCGFFKARKIFSVSFAIFFSPFWCVAVRGSPPTWFQFYLYISPSVPIIIMFEYLMHIVLQGAALSSWIALNFANRWALIGTWVHI